MTTKNASWGITKVAIGFTFILAACGDDSSSGGAVTSASDLVVTKYDDLPVCSDAREGVVAYVKEKNAAYVCVDGDWTFEKGSSDSTTPTAGCSSDSGRKLEEDSSSSMTPHTSISSDSGKKLEDESSSSTTSTTNISSSNGRNPEESSSSQEESEPIMEKSIEGKAQPFLKGGVVTAYELNGDKSLSQTGRTFSGNITQADGRFNLNNMSLKSSYVRLSTNGFYRNVVSGENSNAAITLNAVTDLSARNTVNVNLLTHLELGRVLQLMEESDGSLKITDAKKQAEKEIFEAFHIDATDFGFFEDLDILGNTEADAALLAISIMLQGNRSESELTELLLELSEDLSDGKWDDDENRMNLAIWAFEKEFLGKIADYRSNVEKWGLSTTVLDFEKFMHQFWYGEMETCSDINEGEWGGFSNRNALFVMKCENGMWNTRALKDPRDNQDYRVIKIGDQVWMAENLNFKTSSSFCYENEDSYCSKYGRLYSWAAAVDKPESECGSGVTCSLPSGNVQGVCPPGWHLPTEAEWNILLTEVGAAGTMLKSHTGWEHLDDDNASDAYGFSALPVGYWRYDDLCYNNMYCTHGFYNNAAIFWSASQHQINDYSMGYPIAYPTLYKYHKNNGFSVRCLQD